MTSNLSNSSSTPPPPLSKRIKLDMAPIAVEPDQTSPKVEVEANPPAAAAPWSSPVAKRYGSRIIVRTMCFQNAVSVY